jgi:hypothetical protein
VIIGKRQIFASARTSAAQKTILMFRVRKHKVLEKGHQPSCGMLGTSFMETVTAKCRHDTISYFVQCRSVRINHHHSFYLVCNVSVSCTVHMVNTNGNQRMTETELQDLVRK